MSKYQVRRTIRKELENLNKRIDQKIIRGLSYAQEARRHKTLLARLYGLERGERSTFLGKFTSVFSF